MKKPENIQDGPIAPITLTLAPAAFTAALAAIIPPGKVGWTSDDHWGLVSTVLPRLKTETGDSPIITTALGNILRLIYKPSEDAERDVLRQGFRDAGYVLDEATEALLVMMFSAPQFGDFLSKRSRPHSSEKFIQKDKTKKRGAKKETFESLFSSQPATSAPVQQSAPLEVPAEATAAEADVKATEDSPATAEETTTDEPKSMEPPPITPKPATTKPATRK